MRGIVGSLAPGPEDGSGAGASDPTGEAGWPVNGQAGSDTGDSLRCGGGWGWRLNN